MNVRTFCILLALLPIVSAGPALAADEAPGNQAASAKSTSKPVYTNESLEYLSPPDHSQLPALEFEPENPPVGTITGDIKVDDAPLARVEADMNWVENALARNRLMQRITDAQRRLRDAERELNFLQSYGDRPKGSVAGDAKVTTATLVSRGVADANTPQRLEKSAVAAELEAARVELDRLLKLQNEMATAQPQR
jgi:hypothetical protein